MLKKNQKTKNRLRFCNKLFIIGVISIFLISTGIVGWFYDTFLTLKGTVQRKGDDLAFLKEKNAEFSRENIRHKNSNEKLGREVVKLDKLNQEYANQNAKYKNLVNDLSTVSESLYNTFLVFNETNNDLKIEGNEFVRLVDRLKYNVVILQTLASILEKEGAFMNETEKDIKKFNSKLNGTLTDFNEYIYDLQSNATTLENVTSFIYKYAEKSQKSVELFVQNMTNVAYQNQNISDEVQRQLLKKTLTKISNVGLGDLKQYFNVMSDFDLNKNMLHSYPEGLQVVRTKVLSELCGNVTDFEAYILKESGHSEIKVNQTRYSDMLDHIYTYQNMLRNYYFLQKNNGGITREEWKEAGYKCFNLHPQVAFFI